MPTYEYECRSCGHTFDAFQSMSDEPLKSCPECGKEVRRLIHGGAGIIFKGSGFYVTDKKGGSGSASSRAPAKSQDAQAQDGKSQETRSQESRSQESKSQESRSQESKSQESRSQESKSQESRSQEAKSQEAKSQKAGGTKTEGVPAKPGGGPEKKAAG
jgi:putative FmdB family regulatory protein